MKLLIVDDQPSVHKYMNTVFDWLSLGVEEKYHAYDGKEALDIILNSQPDLVLLDIKMPKMDGLQLIHELAGLQVSQKIVILSAYNEFEYARQAMRFGVKDYLLKPIDSKKLGNVIINMSNEIKKEKNAIVEEVLSSAAYGFKCSEKALKAFNQMLLARNFSKLFCAAVIFNSFDTEMIMGEFKEALNTKEDDYFQLQVSREELMLLGLICGEDIFPKSKGQELAGLIKRLKERYPDAYIKAGISNASEEVQDIHSLYDRSKEALKQAFYSDDVVFYHSCGIIAKSIDKAAVDTLSKEILDCIRMNFYEFKCIDAIGEFFNYFRRFKVSRDLALQACESLIATINEKLLQDYNNKDIFFENIPNTCYAVQSDINSLELEFSRKFFAMLRKLKAQRPKSDNDIIKEIKLYIDENYNESLSLESVSEKFFISKYQLSRLFKKDIGINYWDYVIKVRMEKASMLIVNSGKKIYEIAETVGYEDISYFSTNFKKYFGKSPKEYKLTVENPLKSEKMV